MIKVVAMVMVIVCTFGGFLVAGGKVKIITGLIMPAMLGESIIILGCAICAFLIANLMRTIKKIILSY
jgi:flagellar motor component MotA